MKEKRKERRINYEERYRNEKGKCEVIREKGNLDQTQEVRMKKVEREGKW